MSTRASPRRRSDGSSLTAKSRSKSSVRFSMDSQIHSKKTSENSNPNQTSASKRRQSVGIMKSNADEAAKRRKSVSFGVVDLRIYEKNSEMTNTVDLGSICLNDEANKTNNSTESLDNTNQTNNTDITNNNNNNNNTCNLNEVTMELTAALDSEIIQSEIQSESINLDSLDNNLDASMVSLEDQEVSMDITAAIPSEILTLINDSASKKRRSLSRRLSETLKPATEILSETTENLKEKMNKILLNTSDCTEKTSELPNPDKMGEQTRNLHEILGDILLENKSPSSEKFNRIMARFQEMETEEEKEKTGEELLETMNQEIIKNKEITSNNNNNGEEESTEELQAILEAELAKDGLNNNNNINDSNSLLEETNSLESNNNNTNIQPSSILKFSQFLENVGISGLEDNYNMNNKRDSSFGRVNSENCTADWPPKQLNELLEFVLLDETEIDSYQAACLHLLDAREQIKLNIQNLETNIYSTNPQFFQQLLNNSNETKLKELKQRCELESKRAWYEWRLKLNCVLVEKFQQHKLAMLADIQTLKEMNEMLQTIQLEDKLINDTNLIQLRTQIGHKSTQLKQLELQLKQTTEKKLNLQTQLENSQLKLQEFDSKINIALQKQIEIEENEAKLSVQQEEFNWLKNNLLKGIEFVSLTNHSLELKFHQLVNFKAEWNTTNQLISKPKLEIRIQNNNNTNNLIQFLLESALSTESSLSTTIETVKTKSELKELVSKLHIYLGRIHDFNSELIKLSKQWNIQIYSNGTISISVSDSSATQEIVLYFTVSAKEIISNRSVQLELNQVIINNTSNNNSTVTFSMVQTLWQSICTQFHYGRLTKFINQLYTKFM